jgi:hypothetical protein
MKMFYDDFEVGDTIGYDENRDGRLTGRMIEHVLTEISLKDIKTWEKKENPHNMRIIKKATNKTTQQTIDEDFEGGLTMGQITPPETIEYDLLQHIKFCLECKNESQAIRLIEKYGFEMQEQDKNVYSEFNVKTLLIKLRHEILLNGDVDLEEWFEQFKNK